MTTENPTQKKVTRILWPKEEEGQMPHACQITITCSKPNHAGEMDVKMDYEGDPMIVRYLLETASDRFEGDLED